MKSTPIKERRKRQSAYSEEKFINRVKASIKKGTFLSIPGERSFLYRHLSVFAKGLKNKRILDIGEGPHEYWHLFQEKNFYESCDLANRFNPQYQPDIVSSVYDIPVEERIYDGVLLLQVLEHLEYPIRALKEIHRVLKKNGFIYISVPQAAGDHFEPHHYFNYTQYGLRSVLGQSGFQIIEHHRLAGMFVYVGNRLMKLGAITFKQYRWSREPLQKCLALIFYIFCYLLGLILSVFNFVDKKKHYCIGHIVVARKI